MSVLKKLIRRHVKLERRKFMGIETGLIPDEYDYHYEIRLNKEQAGYLMWRSRDVDVPTFIRNLIQEELTRHNEEVQDLYDFDLLKDNG